MASNEVYTFSEEGMRKLVEAYREQAREYGNLKRTLAHFSTRRHQTVYMPNKEWKLATATTLYPGTWVAGASGSVQEHTFTYLSTSDSATTFELDASPGNIEIKRTILPCFVNASARVSVPFVRNEYCDVSVQIQSMNPDTLVWGGTGTVVRGTTAWPDVAVLSGSGGTNIFEGVCVTGIGFDDGRKLRLAATVNYSGSAPTITVACSGLSLWYQ